jgi:hypothetical protein
LAEVKLTLHARAAAARPKNTNKSLNLFILHPPP